MGKKFNTELVIGGKLDASLSQAFGQLGKYYKQQSKEMQKCNSDAAKFSKKMDGLYEKTSKALKTSAKFVAGAALGGLAVGAKVGLTEAANMEQYRNTLEVVMKDTKKAGKTFQWAVKFANKTPFDTGEVVEATTKLTSYGLKAQSVLPKVGDMASAMGKSMDQAVEAVADAQTGELERLKEFGITKQQIIDHANKIMRGKEIVNAKGQITDQKNFNKALFSLMEERYSGSMIKQAKSLKGLMSTVGGVAKSGLAKVMGITDIGTTAKGSMFDVVKKQMTTFTAEMEKMQSNGTFDKLQQDLGTFAKDVGDGISAAMPHIIDFVSYCLTHVPQIATGIKALAVGFAGFKIAGGITEGVKTFKLLKGAIASVNGNYLLLLGTKLADKIETGILYGLYMKEAAAKGLLAVKNGILTASSYVLAAGQGVATAATTAFGAAMAFVTSPIFLVAAAIAAVVAVSYLVYTHWQQITSSVSGWWYGTIMPAFSAGKAHVQAVWDGIKNGAIAMKNSVVNAINSIISKINSIKLPSWIPFVGGKGLNIPTIGGKKGGKSGKFAKGGLATQPSICGEAGPEMVIPLNDKARSLKLLSITNRIFGMRGSTEAAKATIKSKALKPKKARAIKPKKPKIGGSGNNGSGSGSTVINFNPTIYCNSGDEKSVKSQCLEAFAEFKRLMRELKEEEERENVNEPIFDL